ncbi:MAG TPA: glycosyltransferase [Actinomycetota bacterium]
MRALWASTVWPWPLDTGGRIRAFQMLELLAGEAETVTVFGTADSAAGVADLRAALPPNVHVEEPVVWANRIRRSPAALLRTAVRALRSGEPYRTAKFGSPEAIERLAALLPAHDVLYVHYLGTAGIVEAARARAGRTPPVVFDAHQVEQTLAAEVRRSLRGARRALSPLLGGEVRRLARFESRFVAGCAAVIAITPEDAIRFRALGAREVVAVPPGAWPVLERPGPGAEVLVLGTWHWPPSAAALEEMLPALATLPPSIVPVVAGAGASRSLRRRLRAAGLRHAGYVEDLEPYWRRARVVVIPGAGTGARMRFPEAFRRGVPVVATVASAAGFDATGAGTIVERPGWIADSIRRIVADDDLAAELSAGASRLAARVYDRDSLAALMRPALAAARAPAASPPASA